MAHAGYVAVGCALAPWGASGYVKVDSLTDFADRFAPGAVVYIDETEHRVEACRWQKGQPLVKLSGVDDAAAAGLLRGRLFEVPEGQRHPLEEGQYYLDQIIGLDVRSGSGEALGRVVEVMHTPANDVYVVQGELGEVLLPAIADVIRRIDLAGGWMEVEPLADLSTQGEASDPG